MWTVTEEWPEQRRILIIHWTGLDRMIFSVIPVSLSPQPPLLLLSGLIRKVVLMTEIKVICGVSNIYFQSPRLTVCGHCWMSKLPPPKADSEYPIWCHSQGWSASNLVAGWLHRTVSITEGAAFCSYLLSPPSWYSPSIVSDQEMHFMAK